MVAPSPYEHKVHLLCRKPRLYYPILVVNRPITARKPTEPYEQRGGGMEVMLNRKKDFVRVYVAIYRVYLVLV